MTWGPWQNISSGATTAGGSITAVDEFNGFFTLFLADPGGGVFTARGNHDAGWGPWQSVSEGRTMPGAPITAVNDGDGLSLFLADPGGGVYTAWGNHEIGWGPWKSVSSGATTPGAPITGVFEGNGFISLFLADPGGGVYNARGNHQAGWGPWQSVSQGSTTPGGHVAAVAEFGLAHGIFSEPDGFFQVFLADPGGSVFTVRGNQTAGWGQWQSVSGGQSTPGGALSVIESDGAAFVFLADPNGGVYMTGGDHVNGWAGWQSVSDGRTTPGAPIAAVLDQGFFRLFLADPNGGVYTVRGLRDDWGLWSSVSAGTTRPGAPIAAISENSTGFVTLFTADGSGGPYTTTESQVPAAPTNLSVIAVTDTSISVSWQDNADNETGFRVSFVGTAAGLSGDERSVEVADNHTTLTQAGLLSGYTYTITVIAYNSVGTSAPSNAVLATTPDSPRHVGLTLVHQPDEGLYFYKGQYPPFGEVQPGHALSITVPAASSVVPITDVGFLVAGEFGVELHLPPGATTAPGDMLTLFGAAPAPYTSAAPLTLAAIVAQTVDVPIAELTVTLEIVSDVARLGHPHPVSPPVLTGR